MLPELFFSQSLNLPLISVPISDVHNLVDATHSLLVPGISHIFLKLLAVSSTPVPNFPNLPEKTTTNTTSTIKAIAAMMIILIGIPWAFFAFCIIIEFLFFISDNYANLPSGLVAGPALSSKSMPDVAPFSFN